jgi:hypothetical protein
MNGKELLEFTMLVKVTKRDNRRIKALASKGRRTLSAVMRDALRRGMTQLERMA